MITNYILVATFSGALNWGTMTIHKPHIYITACLADGRQLHEEHIKDVLKAWPATPSKLTWECVNAWK